VYIAISLQAKPVFKKTRFKNNKLAPSSKFKTLPNQNKNKAQNYPALVRMKDFSEKCRYFSGNTHRMMKFMLLG